MSRLRTLATALARESGQRVEVIEYGLKVGIYNLLGFLAVIAVGIILGKLPTVMAAYFASGSLRMVSGGTHTATPVRCITLTSVLFGMLGLAGYYAGPFCAGLPLHIGSAVALLWVLFVILRFAPRDVPNKPIKERQGKKLKKWAVAVWLTWALLLAWAQFAGVSPGLVLSALLGLVLQSVSLVPWRGQRDQQR